MSKLKDNSERTRNSYEALTPKQQSAVDSLVDADPDDAMTEIAEDAGVSDSYVYYVEKQFGDIIEEREAANRTSRMTDGGHGGIEVAFTEDEAFRAMRILPSELSQVVYQAIRRHQPRNVEINSGDGDE